MLSMLAPIRAPARGAAGISFKSCSSKKIPCNQIKISYIWHEFEGCLDIIVEKFFLAGVYSNYIFVFLS